MPFVEIDEESNNDRNSIRFNSRAAVSDSKTGPHSSKKTQIFYETFGRGETKVILIMGFAATHHAWGPQLLALAGTNKPNSGDNVAEALSENSTDEDFLLGERDGQNGGAAPPIEEVAYTGRMCCAFDNRGVGRSTVPKNKKHYTSIIMAQDALAVMDHLGWGACHVIGHSMGGMIACKLAAMAPHRVLSLGLISITGGGFQIVPRLNWKFASLCYRMLKAKTPEARAAVDLELHYSKEYLEEEIKGQSRRLTLHQEYSRRIHQNGFQESHGMDGHMAAVWTHSVTSSDVASLQSGGFLISVIHGQSDKVAQLKHGRNLAWQLQPATRMVELKGAHMVTMENPDEVNSALLELLEAAESGISSEAWMEGGSLPVVDGRCSKLLGCLSPCS